MARTMSVAALCALIAVLGLGACGGEGDDGAGGDEEQIRAVSEAAAEAIANQDAGGFCELVDAPEMERSMGAEDAELACERHVVGPELAELSPKELADAESLAVESVEIDGDAATAEMTTHSGEDEEAAFRRVDGEWKLAATSVFE